LNKHGDDSKTVSAQDELEDHPHASHNQEMKMIMQNLDLRKPKTNEMKRRNNERRPQH